MNEQINIEVRRSTRIGRKLLQQSSINPSDTSFIVLISVIGFLVVLIIILLIFLIYRYCFHEEKPKKRPKKFKPILSYPDEIPTRKAPISISSISTAPITTRSIDALVPTRPRNEIDPVRQAPRMNMVDNYLRDVPALDPKQLDPFLFIDLHSTSSETFPETRLQQIRNRQNLNNTSTSGYHTTTMDEEHLKKRTKQMVPHRSWRPADLKRLNQSRFLVRERALPTNLKHLPQLRTGNLTSFEKNPSDSSFYTNNEDLLSTNVSMTTNDYDDSHAYHVHQQQIMQTIREEKENHHRAHYVEVVSTYRGDDSDLPAGQPLKNVVFMNDSIIV